MPNPLSTATKGKGFIPTLKRGQVIVSRYGLTPNKLGAALATMTNTLLQYGCSATIPVTASAIAANPAIAQQVLSQGIELAVHGFQHLDHSMLGLETQIDHLHRARAIFQNLGIPIEGFRCPYLRWNANTLAALRETGFSYDSSQALALDVVGGSETVAYRRALDFYSAQMERDHPALPSLLDGLIRIPYCLPDDEALIDRLHITDGKAIAEIWLAMLDCVYRTGELLTLGLHPERVSACQTALQIVLAKARSLSPGVWIARLDEIVAWFRSLGETAFEIHPQGGDLYHIKIAAPDRATILVRSLEPNANTQSWMASYHKVFMNEFTLKCNKRPLVGLAPGSPNSLKSFLRHQGYLAETCTDSQDYTIFLDLSSFRPEDERPLITKLEGGDWPVVRLSRWPEAARCGLAITGDVDAFTIWDYAKRILPG